MSINPKSVSGVTETLKAGNNPMPNLLCFLNKENLVKSLKLNETKPNPYPTPISICSCTVPYN